MLDNVNQRLTSLSGLAWIMSFVVDNRDYPAFTVWSSRILEIWGIDGSEIKL